jgi:hypothetical protein
MSELRLRIELAYGKINKLSGYKAYQIPPMLG